MALKAGRVGVAKDQVDEFGNITGGSTPENVYTKQQCDNKFETKTHANNTFQQKNIEVPLELLGGSQLTVETSLHALEDTLGTLRFRDNDGTAQYKLPNGDWANFSSGGSSNYIYQQDVTASGVEFVLGAGESAMVYDCRSGTTRRYIPQDSDIVITNYGNSATIGRVIGGGSLSLNGCNKITNNGSTSKTVKYYYTTSMEITNENGVNLMIVPLVD